MLSATTRFFPTLTLINRAGTKIPIKFEAGQRLFDALENTPAEDLKGPCGGNCACGGCHVILPENVFSAPGDDEHEVLEDAAARTKTSRLACQLSLSDAFDGAEIKYGNIE